MSIKALYVGECHKFIDKTLAQLEQIHTQIKNIQKSIEGIIALEEAFKGKTANSIRTFYKEVHKPFLLFLEGFIDNYSNTLREIKQSIDELEPDRNGVIREDFLAGGVQRGLKRAEHMAMMLTDEANAVLRSVKDIIHVKDLDDGEFLDKVQHAKKMTHKTIERLYLFDRHHTAKLEPVEQDLHTMKNYVSRIRELGNSGQINIATYQARKIADQKIHKQLMQGLVKRAGKNAIDLEVIMGELGKRLFSKFIPLAAIPINYMQKHFGLKTMNYSYRAMHAVLAATGDSLTASEFSTIEHLIVSKVKVSDYKGVRQGTYYTLADGRIVRKFKSETGINYELVRTIPANRHKSKEPEKSWLEKAAGGVKDTFVKAGEFGASAVKETADFVLLDDVKTVMNPEASKVDRIIAGASIVPAGKALKLIKTGGTIKFANKGKHTAKRVRVSKSSGNLRNKPGVVTKSFNLDKSLSKQTKLMYNKGTIGIIPKKVRDDLLGKHYRSFDEFRKDFWKSIAKSNFAKEFNSRNVSRMLEGNSPIAPKLEHYGKHKSYILHHKQPIDKGGDVYNLDNLMITSPKMHQNILDPAYHFGKKANK